MLFNSFTFIFFFAIVLLVHSLPLPWRLRKFNLLIASYLFYAAWNPPYVLLLMFYTLVSWFAAKGIAASSTTFGRRCFLLVSLTSNLGLLFFFKYTEPALEAFTQLVQSLGWNYQPVGLDWDIVLPLGISFYTFQTLSYTIDVYWGHMKPWPSLLDFAMFVAFFPHLIAGPILRASHFLPQCSEPKRATGAQLGWGMSLIVLGLFMKIVLADSFFAPVANTVYQPNLKLSMFDAWFGTISFVGQLYTDFAGYSTCAVGLALCLGFEFPANFRFPLACIGISDFWRRWHISLSTWLHDYLFMPLGGYWKGRARAALNLMITMILCGLWHGATGTFLIFGALHGLYTVGELSLRRTWLHRLPLWQTIPGKVILWALTMVMLTFSIVFFRATNLEHAFAVVRGMVGLQSSGIVTYISDVDVLFVCMLLESMVLIHVFLRSSTSEESVSRWPWWVWSILVAAMLYAIIRVPGRGGGDEFIYFQF